jgi:hypothetical protein
LTVAALEQKALVAGKVAARARSAGLPVVTSSRNCASVEVGVEATPRASRDQ